MEPLFQLPHGLDTKRKNVFFAQKMAITVNEHPWKQKKGIKDFFLLFFFSLHRFTESFACFFSLNCPSWLSTTASLWAAEMKNKANAEMRAKGNKPEKHQLLFTSKVILSPQMKASRRKSRLRVEWLQAEGRSSPSDAVAKPPLPYKIFVRNCSDVTAVGLFAQMTPISNGCRASCLTSGIYWSRVSKPRWCLSFKPDGGIEPR